MNHRIWSWLNGYVWIEYEVLEKKTQNKNIETQDISERTGVSITSVKKLKTAMFREINDKNQTAI